jgi:hypothetical protein
MCTPSQTGAAGTEDGFDLTCILVHGTFARKAPWTTRGSPLRQQILSASKTAGVRVRFRPLVWSGKNLLAHRRRASERLSRLIERGQKNQRFILVGHSHGGSSIAYFLKRQKEMPSNVLGCIFLSTPFVALKARKDAVKIALAAYMVLLSAIFAITSVLHLPPWFFSVLSTIIIPMLGVQEVDYSALERRISEEQTASLPSGNYLFLRSSGDEAAAGLSFAQFSTWISSKLLAMFLLRLMRFVPLRKRILFPFSIPRAFLMVMVVSTAAIAAVNVVPETREALLRFPDQSIDQMVGPIAFLIFLWTFSLLFILGFCAVIVTLLGLVVQAVTSLAFGWTSFLDGFLLDMAVEPIPFGSHCLVHVPWSDRLGASELTHSSTYEHETSLRQIHAWLSEALTRSHIHQS